MNLHPNEYSIFNFSLYVIAEKKHICYFTFFVDFGILMEIIISIGFKFFMIVHNIGNLTVSKNRICYVNLCSNLKLLLFCYFIHNTRL